MRKRCYNPAATNYKRYGGRGITVCDEWQKYVNFRKWALENGYDDSKSIDRIDNNKGYEPNNCRWTDATGQANNRTTNAIYEYNGEKHTLSEWARIYGIKYKFLHKKIHSGQATLGEILLSLQSK